MKIFSLCLGLTSLTTALFGEALHSKKQDDGPYFTGPLITGSAHVVPVGHINFEPYYFSELTYGSYNSEWKRVSAPTVWSQNLQFPFQVGISQIFDIEIVPSIFFNESGCVSASEYGDTVIGCDLQLIEQAKTHWIPDTKFLVRHSLPTGKYKNLKSDASSLAAGSGAFSTGVGLGMGKLIKLNGSHYLNARLEGSYTLSGSADIENISVYGGALGTDGRVNVGNSFDLALGLEYLVAKHWVVAADLTYSHKGRSTFKGKTGFNPDMTPATVGGPSSDQFTFAPALEYNYSSKVGIIAGYWMTIAGRNSSYFRSAIVAINFYR